MSTIATGVRHLVLGVTFALALTLLSPAVMAVEVPWINVGSGFIPEGFSVTGEPKPYKAGGFSVPVGKYFSEGNSVEVTEFDEPTLSGEFKGDFNFQNRFLGGLRTTFGDVDNGAAQPGTFTAIDQGDGTIRIFFFAEFNPIDGESTGLFKNVTGGRLLMPAISDPFSPSDIDDEGETPPIGFTWVGFGYLEFGGSDD